jgi:hypothetical protein
VGRGWRLKLRYGASALLIIFTAPIKCSLELSMILNT